MICRDLLSTSPHPTTPPFQRLPLLPLPGPKSFNGRWPRVAMRCWCPLRPTFQSTPCSSVVYPKFSPEKKSFPPSPDMAEIQPTFLIKGFFWKETLDLLFYGAVLFVDVGVRQHLVDYLRFIWWIIKSKISLENLNSGLDFSKHPTCFWDVFYFPMWICIWGVISKRSKQFS